MAPLTGDLGLSVLDPATGTDLADERVRADVLLATASRGGADPNPAAAAKFPWLNPDFSHLTEPTLVVAGDATPTRSPPAARLAHRPLPPSQPRRPRPPHPARRRALAGGITGYAAADLDPARVRTVQIRSTAFLCSALREKYSEWERVWSHLSTLRSAGSSSRSAQSPCARLGYERLVVGDSLRNPQPLYAPSTHPTLSAKTAVTTAIPSVESGTERILMKV